jgi:UDP-glucose 4-epimerase
MKLADVTKLVFSSSCSVYGQAQGSTPVTETAPLQPISPYGRSKMFAELMISDSIREGWLSAVSLRYFNVVGNAKIAAFDGSIFNLFPNLYRAIENGSELSIFGIGYDTNDGTCIRDYVHVSDLAVVHLKALDQIVNGVELEFAYNLGSGIGYSVLEIIQASSRVIKKDLNYKIEMAREGDPAELCADIQLAKRDLDWSNLRGLDEMLEDGWWAWGNKT